MVQLGLKQECSIESVDMNELFIEMLQTQLKFKCTSSNVCAFQVGNGATNFNS